MSKYEYDCFTDLFSQFRKCDMRRLLSIMIYSGFRLSQPHLIYSVDDSERIIKYLKAPVSFVMSALEENFDINQEYVSSESAVLCCSHLITDQMMIAPTEMIAMGSAQQKIRSRTSFVYGDIPKLTYNPKIEILI